MRSSPQSTTTPKSENAAEIERSEVSCRDQLQREGNFVARILSLIKKNTTSEGPEQE